MATRRTTRIFLHGRPRPFLGCQPDQTDALQGVAATSRRMASSALGTSSATPAAVPSGVDGASPLQLLALAFLGSISLLCVHALLFHLHAILVPFVLSGFLVLAVEPQVEALYKLLTGLSRSRCCCCWCCVRRQPASEAEPAPGEGGDRPTADEESQAELRPLLTKPVGLVSEVADGLCRLLAVTLVMLAMLLVVFLVGVLLFQGAVHMKGHWAAYTAGAQHLIKACDDMIDAAAEAFHVSSSVDVRIKEAYNSVLGKTHDGLWMLINVIVAQVSVGISSGIMMFLYLLFWLLSPLPIGGTASALVRSYIRKKTCVSALYGICVALLFFVLGIDLAILFGVVSFFLNFVPEVGAFISMLLPVPVIILDSRLESPFLVLLLAFIGQLVLKFIFSNILEVKLIERDREMNIHPVWVIFGLSYFGFVWGPIGMLISVPMMAMLKTGALSVQVSLECEGPSVAASLLEGFVACLEGRSPEKASRNASRSAAKASVDSADSAAY